jgi:L-fuconolactonase
MIVDSHQHFWDPARGDYGWLTPDLPIHRVYGADDLRPLLQAAGVNATILVQAAPSTAETDYMLSIARRTPWVLGVVGWIDLAAADAADQVQARAQDPLVLGLRPMLQDIAQPDWILAPGPEPALRAIAAEGLVFDALIKSHQVGVIEELAGRHPQLSIVLDHGAKPRLGDVDAMAAWRADMARLAAHPNVVCKLSGLLTELMPGGRVDDVRDAAGILFDLFGPERLLSGLARTGARGCRGAAVGRGERRHGRQCVARLSAGAGAPYPRLICRQNPLRTMSRGISGFRQILKCSSVAGEMERMV